MKKRLILGLAAVIYALAIQNGFLEKSTMSPRALEPGSQNMALVINATIVTKVIDGDTITIDNNGILEKVRLIGVDTPETVDPRKPVQCFGKEASAFTKSLLLNKEVRLESDRTQGDRDKYGRMLRYVFLKDGTLVNEKIVAEGYGHEYTYHTPYKYQAELKIAERSARELQKGLWGASVCGN